MEKMVRWKDGKRDKLTNERNRGEEEELIEGSKFIKEVNLDHLARSHLVDQVDCAA